MKTPERGDKLVYCFDIDGTICTLTNGAYAEAEPLRDRIAHVNALYAEGHVIKMFTARGSTTGIDWTDVTARQLADWGVDYHELILGKPHFDLLIDDKAIGSEHYDW